MLKDPEVRKSEIIEAAQKLFFKQGYDNTPINDILKTTGIAKGTFYHYFSSKEELLTAMVGGVADEAIEQIQNIMASSLSPLEKLSRAFGDAQNIKAENTQTLQTAYESLFRDDNIKLRIKINEEILHRASPLVAKILEEGFASGEFQPLSNRQESLALAETIMALGVHMGNRQAKILVKKETGMIEELLKSLDSFEKSVERLLALPSGSLQIADRGELKKRLKKATRSSS